MIGNKSAQISPRALAAMDAKDDAYARSILQSEVLRLGAIVAQLAAENKELSRKAAKGVQDGVQGASRRG